MSITFDRASNIFQLNTKTTSYLIGIADGKIGRASCRERV